MQDLKFKPGIKGEQSLKVAFKDTASAYGSGLVEVFATPAMVALMELTARQSVEPFLPDGHTTVGMEVNIKHLRPSKIGNTVRCESKLVEIEGRKLLFEVQVWDGDALAGLGTHKRAVIDMQTFLP